MIKVCELCEEEFDAKKESRRFCSDLCRASFNQSLGVEGEIIVKIYELINPINNSIFYVGKTIGSLEKRLSCHLSSKEGAKKILIINEIIENGQKPKIREIERHHCFNEEDELEALKREEFWIKKYISDGILLSNFNGVARTNVIRLRKNHELSGYESRPYPLRFNNDQMNFLLEYKKLKSPQDALNFLLTDFYQKNNGRFNFSNINKTNKDYSIDNKSLSNNESIKKEIEAILSEKIPPERDTQLGRKYWNIEKSKRIKELESKL